MSPAHDRPGSAPFRICFVCTGNICRSPMAEVVFRDLAATAGVSDLLRVGSAGTGDWHVGEQADSRAIAALSSRGLDGTRHRARQFDPAWFADLDLIVAFDRGQQRILKAWAGDDTAASKVQLLLSFDPKATGLDVPDPYYSDARMFDIVLGSIERASTALFTQIAPALTRGVA